MSGEHPAPTRGLYSDHFRKFELNVLSMVDSVSLEEEIKLLRLYMRRVLVLAGSIDDLNLAIKVLNTIGSTSQRIMNLHKAEMQFSESKSDQVSQALTRALDQLVEELELDKRMGK